jgi:hypothetical protein
MCFAFGAITADFKVFKEGAPNRVLRLEGGGTGYKPAPAERVEENSWKFVKIHRI